MERVRNKDPLPIDDGSLKQSIERLMMITKTLSREESMAFRKQNAQGQKWVIASISKNVQAMLGANTNQVWLSDDTLIKMLIHHPEQAGFELFLSAQTILDNAVKVVKQDDMSVIYFSQDDKNYIATVKTTKDRNELYLTTIYQIDDKRFAKELDKKKDR